MQWLRQLAARVSRRAPFVCSELVLSAGQVWANCPNCTEPVWLSRLPHPPEIEPLQRNDPPEQVTLEPEYDIVMRDSRPNCPHCKIRLDISVMVDDLNAGFDRKDIIQ
jgi:hypothetical protein